ncbi:Cell death regulator Aven, partial [Tupaia chinensis]
QVEEDSDAETFGEENDEQGIYSKRKIVSNWDRYQDIEKEVNNESGESQRGTDFSVLLSSAGDSFSQFRFAEEKEWDREASCPKQNSAFYVDSESLVRALQELPLSVRLNVAAELIQTTVPLELPQVKPRINDDGKGLGMQLTGPFGPGGRGPISELKSATAGCPMSLGKDSPRPGPSGTQKPASPQQPAADHLEEELDLLLNLDVPIKEGDDILPEQTSQDLKSKKDEVVAQEEKGIAFILFPIHLLDSGVCVRTAPPASPLRTTLLVSVIDPVPSADIYFCAPSLFPPELTFLTTVLTRCTELPELLPARSQH